MIVDYLRMFVVGFERLLHELLDQLMMLDDENGMFDYLLLRLFDEMHWKNLIKFDKSNLDKNKFGIIFERKKYLQHLDFHTEKHDIDKELHVEIFPKNLVDWLLLMDAML